MKDAEAALKALDAYRRPCFGENSGLGLRELGDKISMPASGQARVMLVLEAAETADELAPFARLLGPENAVLEGAVDNVIQFGRLFFLRQRMWDAQPEITLELAKLLLEPGPPLDGGLPAVGLNGFELIIWADLVEEHKHWLLQSLGTRFCAQLLDADPARYQVCFRDLTRNSSPAALKLTLGDLWG
eukprot:s2758_g2.t1